MGAILDKASLVITPNAYKESKLYSVVPSDRSGDLSVVRATTATRVNSAGLIETSAINVPRLDYTSSTCPSILFEPQITNLNLRSNEFTNAYYARTGSTISLETNISFLNFGNTFLFSEGTTSQIKTISNTSFFSTSYGLKYNVSVYIKKNNITNIIRLSSGDTFLSWCNFDISNGTVLSSQLCSNQTITLISDGWYRCSFDFTATNNIAKNRIQFTNNTDTNVDSSLITYVGNSSRNVFISGMQFAVGSGVTSYIPTSNVIITKNADVISKTGISDLIGQTEGTIFFDLNTIKLKPDFNSIMFSDGTDNFRLGITADANFTQLQCVYVSTQTFTTNALALPINTKIKIAIKYSIGELKFFANGLLISSFLPTNNFIANNLSQFRTGRPAGGREFFGEINSILLLKTKLTDSECIQLTTL